MLNISRYPFPRKPWGRGKGEGTGAPPSPSPLNLERWHQASHSLIDIRPGGPLLEDLLPRCVGSVWDVPLGGDGGGWGEEEGSGSRTRPGGLTKMIRSRGRVSGTEVSVRQPSCVCECFCAGCRSSACVGIWIGPQSVKAEVPMGIPT